MTLSLRAGTTRPHHMGAGWMGAGWLSCLEPSSSKFWGQHIGQFAAQLCLPGGNAFAQQQQLVQLLVIQLSITIMDRFSCW